MTKYLLSIDYNPGVIEAPMEEWKPEDVKAHMDYYGALIQDLIDRGEHVDGIALTGPDVAKVVTAGAGAPVVTDGPFAEFKEMLAGFQIVDVDSEERAVEIAVALSRVPGPGGVPQEQPVSVRRIMTDADFELLVPGQ